MGAKMADHQRSVLMSELRAPELRELANPQTIVLIPVASIEQHGPHLPVMTDTLLASEVCRRAALGAVERSKPAIVTECVWSGLSEHHMSLGATITLDFMTFQSLIDGVVESLFRHGFRRFLLVNGHGGNIHALKTIVDELSFELDDADVRYLTYWQAAAAELGGELETQKSIRHACEAETSMVMALRPDLVDGTAFEQAKCADLRDQDGPPEPIYRWQSFAAKTPSGALGDPTAASAEKGEKLLSIASHALAERISAEGFWT